MELVKELEAVMTRYVVDNNTSDQVDMHDHLVRAGEWAAEFVTHHHSRQAAMNDGLNKSSVDDWSRFGWCDGCARKRLGVRARHYLANGAAESLCDECWAATPALLDNTTVGDCPECDKPIYINDEKHDVPEGLGDVHADCCKECM